MIRHKLPSRSHLQSNFCHFRGVW